MMRVTIANDTGRDELFAEIHSDDIQWTEVIFVPKRRTFLLTLFPPMDRKHWTFELEEGLVAIGEAKAALEARGYHESRDSDIEE